jgi:hypothetical protein
MAITAAEKVQIAGGVLNLAYGVLLGYPIVVIRVKGAPATPKYLMATHVGALLHAAVLLGLVWAARLSTLGPGWQEVAAWPRPCRWPRSPRWESQSVSASSSSASSQRCDARCQQPGRSTEASWLADLVAEGVPRERLVSSTTPAATCECGWWTRPPTSTPTTCSAPERQGDRDHDDQYRRGVAELALRRSAALDAGLHRRAVLLSPLWRPYPVAHTTVTRWHTRPYKLFSADLRLLDEPANRKRNLSGVRHGNRD